MDRAPDEDEARRLLQELQLHQAELALQNEELQTARTELDRSLRRYVDLYESAPVGLATVDRHGVVLEINVRGRALLGGRGFGSSLYDAIEGDFRDDLMRLLATRAPGRGLTNAEIKVKSTAGAPRTLLAEVRVNPSGDGTMLVALTNVTERREAEAALTDARAILALSNQQVERDSLARAELEAANRSKSDFLARMSHDLRTPLNAVLGFAKLLSRNETVSSSEEAAAQVRHIQGAGEHLLAMVDDMLDLTRIEAGNLRLSMEAVAIGPLLGECVVLTAGLAESHEVRVRGHEQPGLCWVHGDRTRLRQVLINLLSNAIKYNRRGGEVEAGLTEQGGHVVIAVRDTGCGMTPDQLQTLFQAFNRLGAEHRGVEGLGLGLVIAKQMVDAMGGSIQVESKPGEGSVFTVRLPCAPHPSVPAPAPDARPMAPVDAGTSASPFVVLYVEDNPVNQTLMRFVVAERPGVRLEIAPDGLAGIDMAHALRPGLIMMDLGLPRLDGFGMLALLQQAPALAAIPCVAVSANAMAGELQRARDAGFDEYLTKPFEVDQVLELIDRTRTAARQPALSREA